jgi:hypothetical protein
VAGYVFGFFLSDRVERWMEIRSELAIAIRAALAAENIPLR